MIRMFHSVFNLINTRIDMIQYELAVIFNVIETNSGEAHNFHRNGNKNVCIVRIMRFRIIKPSKGNEKLIEKRGKHGNETVKRSTQCCSNEYLLATDVLCTARIYTLLIGVVF